MTENTTPKTKFDEWTELKECSDCQRWWNDQCDGNLQSSARPCKQFLATRNVKIPEEINELRTQVERLKMACVTTSIILVVHLALDILGAMG